MKKTFICSLLAVFMLTACATDPYTGESKVSKTAWGTGIGALAGAGIGALAGGEKGALIGAGVGAAAGAGTGAYMDVQARKLRQELLNTGVQVQEANGQIYLIMPGNITFDSNDANIKPAFQPVLNSIAKVINEYSKTMVQVNGYTDSTGSAATNNSLSLRRIPFPIICGLKALPPTDSFPTVTVRQIRLRPMRRQPAENRTAALRLS